MNHADWASPETKLVYLDMLAAEELPEILAEWLDGYGPHAAAAFACQLLSDYMQWYVFSGDGDLMTRLLGAALGRVDWLQVAARLLDNVPTSPLHPIPERSLS